MSYSRRIFLILFCAFFSLSLSQELIDSSRKEDLFQTIRMKVVEGEGQIKKGEFRQAIETFKLGLDLATKTEDNQARAACLMKLGLLYWNEGEIDESQECYSHAVALAKAFKLKDLERSCRNALEIHRLYREGKSYRASGDLQKSIESFKSAVELARKHGQLEQELKCVRQMSISYWEFSELAEFKALNEQALKIALSLKHRKEEGRCLINIGLYYWKSNNFSKSLIYYEKGLRISKELDDKESLSDCLNNLGLIYKNIGNYNKAIEYLSMALELDQKLKNEYFISLVLNNIGATHKVRGTIFYNQSDFDKALFYYQESLKIAEKNNDKKNEIKALNNIGSVYSFLKDHSKALKYFQSAHEAAEKIRDLEAIGMTLNNIGWTLDEQGFLSESINYYQKAINIAQKISHGEILWEAYSGLGQCYERAKRYDLALEYYSQSLAIIDNIRSQIFLDADKAGFLRDKLKVYEYLINLLFKLKNQDSANHYGGEMFHAVERAKARAFLEVLGESKIDIRAKLSPEMKIAEKELSGRISSLTQLLFNSDLGQQKWQEILTSLRQAEDDYLLFLSEARLEIPEVANMISPKPCHLEDVQNILLDEKTALIEYFLGESQSFLFLIMKNRFDLFPLPPREKIKKSLKAYLKILSDHPEGRFKGTLAAKRLYRELFSCAEEKLPDSLENLIIVPDGILYYLPFETLIINGKDQNSEDKYLIEKYQISYTPSSSSLLFLSGEKIKKKYPKSLLAVGNPTYLVNNSNILAEMYQSSGFEISRLPHSEGEVRKISKFFPKAKSVIYLKDEARESQIKKASLTDFQNLHFACHGFLDDKFPYRSALVLSLDEPDSEDGFLQVRELYNLRIDAELVVLSACQTGKGRLENGEGVLGLPRVFFYSGARSVVSSLWTIGDQPTAKFMEYFYGFLSEGHSKVQALRLSKLRMLRSKFSHPFFWAAFVLNGDYSSRLAFH